MHQFQLKNHHFPTASTADACAAAAEIYDCGKKNAPDMTSAIQENFQNSAAAAPVGVRPTLLLISWLIYPKIIDDQTKGSYPELATEFRFCSTEGLPCMVDVWKIILFELKASNFILLNIKTALQQSYNLTGTSN
jgi:hypothetical protein